MNRTIIFSLILLFACSDKNDVDKLNFLKKGNHAFAGNDYNKAIHFYNEAILKDSTFVDAWNNKGLALLKQDKNDEAIYCFGKAIEIKPDYGEAILNNAKANLVVHQHFAALELLENLSKVWPDTSLLFFIKGLVQAETGETVEALANFYLALKADADNAETWVNIANLYYHQHQADSAIKYIKGALKIEANQPHAYNILAMVYAFQENFIDALQAINTAISLAKHNAYFINNKGFILLKLNEMEAAEENIIQSMKMDPYNGWVYRNLGLLRYAQGNYVEAVRLLEKALKIDDEIDHIFNDLALAYRDLGDTVKACEILASASKNEEIESLISTLCK